MTAKESATNRYYSSTIGRFTTVDPLGGSVDAPQSLNRYSYVQGDPVNANDPTGLIMMEGCSFERNCWGSGSTTFDVFGGSYHSFDFVQEFDLNQYGYMQSHMTPDALAGLGDFDQRVQNTLDANAATAALQAGDFNTVLNLMNQNPTLSFAVTLGIPLVQSTITYENRVQQVGEWKLAGSSPSPGAGSSAWTPGDVALNPYAQAVFSSPAIQIAASTMADPRTYVLWGTASLVAGATALLAPPIAQTALVLGGSMFRNPSYVSFAADFLSGLAPAFPIPATAGGVAGVITGQIYEWWKNR